MASGTGSSPDQPEPAPHPPRSVVPEAYASLVTGEATVGSPPLVLPGRPHGSQSGHGGHGGHGGQSGHGDALGATESLDDGADLIVIDDDATADRRQLPRFGLRAKATLALALGALLISVAVATLTYVVARRSLVAERRTVIQQLVYADALEVQAALARSGANVSTVLRRQDQRELSSVVFADRVYTSNPSLSAKRIPADLRAMVAPQRSAADSTQASNGAYAYKIVRQNGRTELIVGVPLPVVNAEFYGVASLSDVERRLRSLARTLAVAALLSSAGAALVGRSVIRRALRPLADVAAGAAHISSGRLDTRLALTGDTDLDPLLASFNDMAQTLQERIEREARFASDVSHELRTPLTALVTAARLLDGRRDELSERSQKTLDVLVMQTQHFERLVLDLLEISRFDAGAAELHVEVVHLPDLIRQVIRLNGSDAAVDWQQLDPPEVGVDKRRVERMVANLLQNAANYGGGATAVRLADDPPAGTAEGDALRQTDGLRRIRICVDDAGPGVPDDERSVIFERFRRGVSHQRSTSAPKGTGLGLALVRAHANLHGGDVWVEDRPGGGARFVVEIAEQEPNE